MIRVNPETGNRTVVSGGSGPRIGTLQRCTDTLSGNGPEFSNIAAFAVEAGGILVADPNLDAVLRVDPVTGDRTVVSGCRERDRRFDCVDMIGDGTEFLVLRPIAVGRNGSIIVADE